jgi:hypothetical protein
MQALTLALQFSSANLLQILHASFEFGTAVAATRSTHIKQAFFVEFSNTKFFLEKNWLNISK